MQVEIYADVVFLINLFMDFFIFWITAKLCRKKIAWLRMTLGAALAALLYCVALFLVPYHILLNLLLSAVLLSLGILIALHPKTVRELAKCAAVAYIAAFAVGGAAFAFTYFSEITGTVGRVIGLTAQHFSVKTLLAAICFSYVALKFGLHGIHKLMLGKQRFYPLKIYFDDRTISVNGLVDTGNSLFDPATDAPVIIAEFMSIKTVLPEKVRRLFLEQREDDLPAVLENVEGTAFAGRIRMIPFTSLGMRNGILIGFKPDKVEILNEKENLTIDNAVIGIYNFRLTRNSEYQALLNPQMCKFES
ncbi:MAG: sigma-E processing peptidase SpoIIGA [Clostridiales bacterium]|nr:sigma-E processing peptidase SpoIIGA [Clostridiales bacterium]